MDMAIEELELKNTYTLNTRAEIAGRDLKYREKFEVVTARAVAPLNILLEYSASFLKVGSIFIAMKTDEQEIEGARKAMKELSFEIDEIESLILPNTDIQRCNIYFRKTKITSEKYPRADGIPKKKPL